MPACLHRTGSRWPAICQTQSPDLKVDGLAQESAFPTETSGDNSVACVAQKCVAVVNKKVQRVVAGDWTSRPSRGRHGRDTLAEALSLQCPRILSSRPASVL
jgi:hypothetical protein